MSDLISREAAIDGINNICPVDTEYDCTLLDRVDVRCVLSDLPSAQPEQHWIPCGEKLPEEGKQVLVCDDFGSVYIAEYEASFDGRWCEPVEYQYSYDIVAWMPLPEPYQKQGD